ncbi:acetyltransferase [Clostridium sp. WILCCON 0269]|uniref:Acetyltransferase n=1 Tax=Candidatus Clostridium eludens TaxID=3381663 RepID=A0ABW8SR12_9CLOT
MLYKDNFIYKVNGINVFGGGAIYEQVKPLLNNENIIIKNVFDDGFIEEKYDINKVNMKNIDLLYCVGYSNMKKRYKRYKEIKEMKVSFISFIADNAIISSETNIGNGTIINQGVIVDNYVTVGECSFINIGATISHHSKIGNNVFIAPGVSIAGCVNVNEGVFIGTNATIIDCINIGKDSVVAAGAVVIKDVPSNCLVAGNPAVIKKLYNVSE